LKTILIFNDYFYPGFKAGGPVQSLINLVKSLQGKYNLAVITNARDLGDTLNYDGVKENAWNSILLPDSDTKLSVWYAGNNGMGFSMLYKIMKDLNPDYIYLNGLYSLKYFLFPAIIWKINSDKIKLIVCPRGMLQKGALQIKFTKKKWYLRILKFSKLLNGVIWQATNQEEKEDIIKHFSEYKNINIAFNIPKPPYKLFTNSNKGNGELKLVYLSLITEKKNLHLLLDIIEKCNNSISLSIYGPIKDEKYWETKCKPLIERLKGKAIYYGDVEPIKVQGVIAQFDAAILLTKGENFGHALYECLSVGRPLITSNYTPWNDLENLKAGWNVDINNIEEIVGKVNEISCMNNIEFNSFCKGAHNVAVDYFYKQNFETSYNELFS